MMNQNYTPQQHQAYMAQMMAQQQQQQQQFQQQPYTMMQSPSPMPPQSAQRSMSFQQSQFIPAPQMANLVPSPSHPPPSKRARPTPPVNISQNVSANAVPMLQDSIEEEEDTSHGDILDHLTQREISEQRYMQHDKWMEEVLGSVFHINEILPGRLGIETIGGDLKSIMASVYDAEGKPLEDRSRDEAATLAGSRAKAKTLELEKDIEKMKSKHQRELSKIKKGSVLMRAERELRSAGIVDLVGLFGLSASVDHGVVHDISMHDNSPTKNSPQTHHVKKSVEEIANHVEKDYKVTIKEVKMVQQINPDGTEMDPVDEEEDDDEIIDDNEMTGITTTSSTSPDGGRVVVPIIKPDDHRDTPMIDVPTTTTIPIAAPPVPMLGNDGSNSSTANHNNNNSTTTTAILPTASPLPSPLPATATPEPHGHLNHNTASNYTTTTTASAADEPPTVPDEDLVPEGFTGGEDDLLDNNANEAFDLLNQSSSGGEDGQGDMGGGKSPSEIDKA